MSATLTSKSRSAAAALSAAAVVLIGLLPTGALAQEADGERAFRQRCGGCHTVEAGQNRAGPHLAAIVGRLAGSVPGARYSNALRDAGFVWDEAALDAFLSAPRQLVPGTSMAVAVPDAEQRAAIISYLSGL